MKKINIVSIATAVAVVLVFGIIYLFTSDSMAMQDKVTVGFICNGDESTPYTYNFVREMKELEAEYGDRIELKYLSNLNEADSAESMESLAETCDIIFTTSFGFGELAKECARKHPDVQFCQATCYNSENDLPNYHTFMGRIYEGRYVAGRVAGRKLRELIDSGEISKSEAKVGYVGAFPFPEVISGYTAFFLGIREEAPEAVMKVKYTNTWTSYVLEKECAEELIDEGCVIISQHSDTIGPAIACENAKAEKTVYHVGYNQSMVDVAPTTSLVSTRINWGMYIRQAVDAVFKKRDIEANVDASIHGHDAGAGFDKNWVQMIELNSIISADGTAEMMDEVIEEIKKGNIEVFKGDYIGVNPEDPSDTIDLSEGYEENADQSAPSFGYVLKDVIEVE